MAGNDTITPTNQAQFWDPKSLPTSNNPPEHYAQQNVKYSEDVTITEHTENPKEIGGRDGAEPTRFGDWEKNGRCVDF
ncbi:DUF1674 domain-containing protein [Magnetovibrio sp. PR-2]|uniref:DUF1674 domain-containing protein n=1 Tax=Magnetovibrio sp. PR-2 TaxID=3120356 RepID=UPI002FCE1BEB